MPTFRNFDVFHMNKNKRWNMTNTSCSTGFCASYPRRASQGRHPYGFFLWMVINSLLFHTLYRCLDFVTSMFHMNKNKEWQYD